jgi:flagellin-like protein
MRKKGVSPVVATVLLIAIVIVLAVIIFLWARGFISEKAEKDGSAVEFSCELIDLKIGIFGDQLEIINRGNVPIYGIDVKLRGTGEVIVNELPGKTVGIGNSLSIDLGFTPSSGDEFNVVPIILGETETGKVAHTCDDQFGYAFTIT